jgi:hypothetical protein
MKTYVSECCVAMAGGASSADPGPTLKCTTNDFAVTREMIMKTISSRFARIAIPRFMLVEEERFYEEETN